MLGLLYRTWGSYNARRALQSLDPILPDGLYGSRPKCFAAQIWLKVVLAIEASYSGGTDLCGIVCDLQKAFNTLPRAVTVEVLAIMGLPFRVLKAWTGAVSSMQRRFQLNGALGPKLAGSAGYPEGDAMSCVAMVGLDALFNYWVTAQFPLCAPLTYVDDWQLLTPQPESVPALLAHVERFTDLIDVSLDKGKTFTWSTSGVARKFLRQHSLGVQLQSRNLGAHVQMCKRHTNAVQMQRVTKLRRLWTLLRLSSAGYASKVRAITASAWPQALHAIAATSLSTQTFKAMRAGALKGLRQDGAGASSPVHLGLVEPPDTDPLCWAILQTLRTIRAGAPATGIQLQLQAWAGGTFTGPSNSVTVTLIHRMQRLGWKILPSGRVEDALGQFQLHALGYAELHFRVCFAWPQVVADFVRHRRGYRGLEFVDPVATRRWLRILSPSDAGAFRKLLNGTHITQDGKAYCQQDGSNVCQWCDCVDSRYHRFWQCDHFQRERSTLSREVFAVVPQLPEAVSCYGWSLRPWTQCEWLRMLQAVPSPDLQCFDPLPPAAVEASVLHLFTDGSCHDQPCAAWRFASSAVALASVNDAGDDSWEFAAHLPGMLQSAFRAEVFALRLALRIAVFFQKAVHIWSDCAAAISFMRRLLSGEEVPPNHAHADLWNLVLVDLKRIGRANVQITKVTSHVDDEAALCPLRRWCAFHNARVDSVASVRNHTRSDFFWDLHARHSQAVNLSAKISREIQHVQLEISRAVLKEASCAPVDAGVGDVVCAPAHALPSWTPLVALTKFPAQAVRWYGYPMVQVVLSWFWSVLHSPRLGPMQWVSHFQLYLDFQISTGHDGPIHDKGWKNSADVPGHHMCSHGFKIRTRWFTKVLKECLRHLQISLAFCFGRPASRYLSLHCGCIGLPWPVHRLDVVDEFLRVHLSAAATRDGKVLDSLPLAGRGTLDAVPLVDSPVE